MSKQEKTQQSNKETNFQCGCLKSSSIFGKIMMKMMKKMCGLQNNEEFNRKNAINETNCCSETN